MTPRRTRSEGSRRRKAGAEEGGAIVQATFAAALTRRRLAELIGVNPTTVRRWEQAGVITPTTESILGSPTKVFDRGDVEFGRRLISLLRSRSGTISLEEAARLVRR